MTAIAAPLTTPAAHRPVWQTLGGGGLLLAGALLLVATLLEYPLLASPGDRGPTFWPFVAAFALSLLAYAAAVFPLAFGSRGSDGIVGRSVVGKAALVAFGFLWLAMQLVYLLAHYFTAADSDFAAVNVATTVLMVLTYLAVIVAGVSIIRARIATGFARWSLLVLMVVAGVCGAIANAVDSVEVLTVAYSLSCVAQLLVGVSYLAQRRPAAGGA